jgi:type VI secretion system protein ImpH
VATEIGIRNPELGEDPALRRLEAEPWVYSFFQAVRLLEAAGGKREPVGEFTPPSKEVARFTSCPTLAFPASEIQSFKRSSDGQPSLEVNFMGLIGPLGVLPLPYSSLTLVRLREKDRAMKDFFDLFNHRFISLFYRAWTKYRFAISYERSGSGGLTASMLALIGLGMPSLQNRQQVVDESFVFYAGLVAQRPRSAEALRHLVADYFDVPVAVKQFAGSWSPLDPRDRTRVGEPHGITTLMGVGTVVGDEVWYMQSKVRLILGPLSRKQFEDFLPGGTAHEPLRAITRMFAEQEMDFEAQLILKREDAPACVLGGDGSGSARLGWISWVKSNPLDRDPSDTVLKL